MKYETVIEICCLVIENGGKATAFYPYEGTTALKCYMDYSDMLEIISEGLGEDILQEIKNSTKENLSGGSTIYY